MSNKSRVEATNGQGSFVASAHLSAIETLGTRVEGTMTAEEALTKGNLANWNVRKWPAAAVNPETGEAIIKPGSYDVVRDNPVVPGQVDVLTKKSVGGSFEIVQNEQHAELLNALVDESGAKFELAGATDGGARVFISMRLPGGIQVGGVDAIDTSLVAFNAHDGSMALTLGVMPVRYACANVLNCLYGGKSNLIRIRHTSGVAKNMATQAREALDITFKYLEGFQAEAERMINTTLTQAKFESIIAQEFFPGEDASNAAFTRSTAKVEKMVELFAESVTHDGVRETAWAGFNAMTEYADHYSAARGNDRDASRANRALLDPTFKNRALELMLTA